MAYPDIKYFLKAFNPFSAKPIFDEKKKKKKKIKKFYSYFSFYAREKTIFFFFLSQLFAPFFIEL